MDVWAVALSCPSVLFVCLSCFYFVVFRASFALIEPYYCFNLSSLWPYWIKRFKTLTVSPELELSAFSTAQSTFP